MTNCQIFTITITGVYEGGAIKCSNCAAGFAPAQTQTVCSQCEPGTYSPNVTSLCLPVPDGYFTDEPGSTTLKKCGVNTQSSADRRSCETDCTYLAATDVFYNISTLYDPENMYFAGVDTYSSYFLNVCAHAQLNNTCSGPDGKPLNTYACKKTINAVGDSDIGSIIGFSPLTNSDLPSPVANPETKGLVVTLTGGTPCGLTKTSQSRIVFLCDSTAGPGHPEPKYENGPEFPTSSCEYSFVWRSSVACRKFLLLVFFVVLFLVFLFSDLL